MQEGTATVIVGTSEGRPGDQHHQLPASAEPTSKSSLGGSRMFTGRIRVHDILGRQDQGRGLISGCALVVAGWIRSIRMAKKGELAFISLSDGSCHKCIQILAESDKTIGFEVLKQAECATGASLRVLGKLVESPAKGQAVELAAQEITLLGGCPPDQYPLPRMQLTFEYLREQAHLRSRTNTIAAMARIRSALSWATHAFFQERGFTHIHTPIITSSDCEGAGEMFQVTTLLSGVSDTHSIKSTSSGQVDYTQDFFGQPTYLTVSGQLNAEHYACSLGSVYTFGPCFRAEHANTRRHLAEFWMIEPEMAFYDLHDTVELAEAYVKYCIRYVLAHYPDDMKWFDTLKEGHTAELQRILEAPFHRITYTEAIEHLSALDQVDFPIHWGYDLSTAQELYLTEKVFKGPVIVTDYPEVIKAFYMRANEDGKTVAEMDLLVPGVGELIGGSQREERLDELTRKLRKQGLSEEAYKAYLDTRRFGSVPHSGFGLGLERLVLFVTGLENIRDAIPFPRFHGHAMF